MFDQLKKMINRSQAQSLEFEPYNQPQHETFQWQPTDVSKLSLTSRRLREIEASLAEKTRAEFAAVTKELNKNQLKDGRNSVENN
ncbi:MAG: hypothetical protein JW757_12280 [Anaerolineales bacterium]|nr:hypothetical protein [Anaerolineales bacterium]